MTVSGDAILQITRVWRLDWPVAHTPPLLPAEALCKPRPDLAIIEATGKAVPYNDYGLTLMVRYGHWQELRAGMRREVNDKTYVSVHSEYGVRWHKLAQIIEWQREYSRTHTKAVAA